MKANKCQHALFNIQQRYYEYGLQVVQLQNFIFIYFGNSETATFNWNHFMRWSLQMPDETKLNQEDEWMDGCMDGCRRAAHKAGHWPEPLFI